MSSALVRSNISQSDHTYLRSSLATSGCFAITTVFSHAQTVVLCGACTSVLCQPTGGKARLTEGEPLICTARASGTDPSTQGAHTVGRTKLFVDAICISSHFQHDIWLSHFTIGHPVSLCFALAHTDPLSEWLMLRAVRLLVTLSVQSPQSTYMTCIPPCFPRQAQYRSHVLIV